MQARGLPFSVDIIGHERTDIDGVLVAEVVAATPDSRTWGRALAVTRQRALIKGFSITRAAIYADHPKTTRAG
jgi:hypothetical protein